MKNLLLISFILFGFIAQAEINLKKLAGNWKGECTQSQSADKQGSVIETYSFTKNGKLTISKEWYTDFLCKNLKEKESEDGSFAVGKENTNNGFNPTGTYEIEYYLKSSSELGLIWINSDYSKLRIARGFGNTQNTMLGLFQYSKQ